MAKYNTQKFEAGAQERRVFWRQDKHHHDATVITAIAQWLDRTYPQPNGVKWTVRANSYRSNQNAPSGEDWVEYTG